MNPYQVSNIKFHMLPILVGILLIPFILFLNGYPYFLVKLPDFFYTLNCIPTKLPFSWIWNKIQRANRVSNVSNFKRVYLDISMYEPVVGKLNLWQYQAPLLEILPNIVY